MDDGGFDEKVVIFGTDNWNKPGTKIYLVFRKGLIDGLYDTAIIAETGYSINFMETRNKFCLSLRYDKSNSFLLVNGVKIYKF